MLSRQPKLIIHGGASSLDDKGGLDTVRRSLHQIVAEVYELLLEGGTAINGKGFDSCSNASSFLIQIRQQRLIFVPDLLNNLGVSHTLPNTIIL